MIVVLVYDVVMVTVMYTVVMIDGSSKVVIELVVITVVLVTVTVALAVVIMREKLSDTV